MYYTLCLLPPILHNPVSCGADGLLGDSKNWSNFAAKQALTMEQKYGKNSIDIEALREFCEREGEAVSYRKDITFEAKK